MTRKTQLLTKREKNKILNDISKVSPNLARILVMPVSKLSKKRWKSNEK